MIQDRYLLVINLPCYLDSEGNRRLEVLWHKDLVKHLDHIAALTLASPLRTEPPPPGDFPVVAVDDRAGTLAYLDLPPCRSTLSALVTLPAAMARLWRAIGRTDFVHANVGGWPISHGWVAVPMARLRGKFVMTNVESASWRMGLRRPWRFKRLAQGVVFEAMARFCVNLSDLVTFTQAGYRDEMLSKRRQDRGHVISASWVDPVNILSDDRAEADWVERLADPTRPLRVVFAGVLAAGKGVDVLLHALELLGARDGAPLRVQLFGEGPLQDACAETSRKLDGGRVILELCGRLAYGLEFFGMLRGQDLLVVPSVSDEQPRVVYDAFAQALPVVASDTTGLVECVADGRNGRVVPAGDPAALADALDRASAHRGRLRELGLAALGDARSLTHDEMHRRRAALIASAVAAGRRAGAVNPA